MRDTYVYDSNTSSSLAFNFIVRSPSRAATLGVTTSTLVLSNKTMRAVVQLVSSASVSGSVIDPSLSGKWLAYKTHPFAVYNSRQRSCFEDIPRTHGTHRHCRWLVAVLVISLSTNSKDDDR